MSREAIYSYSSYIYQRYICILSFLENYDIESIKEEGIEDIDLISRNNTVKSIQVKYHTSENSSKTFNKSGRLYKIVNSNYVDCAYVFNNGFNHWEDKQFYINLRNKCEKIT